VKIYSASDDYSGEYMTNPTIPASLRMDHLGEVFIGDHSIIGSGSVLLPGVKLASGTAVGALSLVKSDTEEFTIYAGAPAKRVGTRSRNVENLAKQLPPRS
jgi:galactoside O-acetyltransferase